MQNFIRMTTFVGLPCSMDFYHIVYIHKFPTPLSPQYVLLDALGNKCVEIGFTTQLLFRGFLANTNMCMMIKTMDICRFYHIVYIHKLSLQYCISYGFTAMNRHHYQGKSIKNNI